MNKKGAVYSLTQVVTIVAGVLAAVMLFAMIARVGSKDAVVNTFITHDSALLVDAMLAAPQSVRGIYSAQTFSKSKDPTLAKVYLEGNFMGMSPTSGSKYDYFRKFIPNLAVNIIPGSSEGFVFFIMKERQNLFMSTSPNYVTLVTKQSEPEEDVPAEEEGDGAG